MHNTYILKAVKQCQEDKKEGKWSIVIPCSWIGILNIVKMSVIFRLMDRFIVTPIKIPAGYF